MILHGNSQKVLYNFFRNYNIITFDHKFLLHTICYNIMCLIYTLLELMINLLSRMAFFPKQFCTCSRPSLKIETHIVTYYPFLRPMSDYFIGGRSFGCPMNAGAAGTFFDAVPRRLIINNHNMSTDTATLLLQFPNQPLWTNVYVQDRAQASVPLSWSRVQVIK